jgi:FtsZ-interacting cell division protein ZipA
MLTGPLFKYLSGGLAIALLIFIGLWKMEQRRGDKFERRVTELTELRKSDRASYEAAQREAKAKNEAEVRQIEERHEQISDRVRSDYRRDLERLRSQTKAPGSKTSGPGVSVVPETTGGADGADPLRLSPDQLLRAQELELQLKYLIEWVQRQSSVAG